MSISKQTGFTLVEVLIAAVVGAIGALALGLMLARGAVDVRQVEQNQLAMTLLEDLANQVRTHQGLADFAGGRNTDRLAAYVLSAPLNAPIGDGAAFAAIGGTTVDCETNACNDDEWAAWRVALWDGALSGADRMRGKAEVQVLAGVRGCIEPADSGARAVADLTIPANTIRISLAWQGGAPLPRDTAAVGDSRNATDCGAGGFELPNGSADNTDQMRRVMYVDVTAFQP